MNVSLHRSDPPEHLHRLDDAYRGILAQFSDASHPACLRLLRLRLDQKRQLAVVPTAEVERLAGAMLRIVMAVTQHTAERV